MKEYYWNDKGHCTNGDAMYFKAGGVTAFYEVAKNKHGYARTYEVHESITSICGPLSWEDEDVTTTKEEAVALVKSELMQALIRANYNGQFDAILMAMGEMPVPRKEIESKPQLTLF